MSVKGTNGVIFDIKYSRFYGLSNYGRAMGGANCQPLKTCLRQIVVIIDDCKIKVRTTFDVYDYAPHPPLTTCGGRLNPLPKWERGKNTSNLLSPQGRGKGEGVI